MAAAQNLMFIFSVFVCLFCVALAPPPRRHVEQKEHKTEEVGSDLNSETLGLEYRSYLLEVVNLLENDKKFKDILDNATDDDIKSGKVADKLHVVDPHVRTKLDELKRIELARLRKHATEQFELSSGLDRAAVKEPLHLEHRNPHTFREDDLRKLVKATAHDLEELDKKRKQQFKRHEMEKEYEYQHKLKAMDEEHKKEAVKKHEEEKAKAKHHEKVHHPLSEDQLEEVWEEQDHMDKDNFDVETFFRMHDVDGNEALDGNEIMALFKPELDKIYKAGEDFDPEEREEEMEEMREAAFEEADTNNDGLISLEEFKASSLHEDYKQDQGWNAIPDRDDIFSSKEFDDFSHEMDEAEHPDEYGDNHHAEPEHHDQQQHPDAGQHAQAAHPDSHQAQPAHSDTHQAQPAHPDAHQAQAAHPDTHQTQPAHPVGQQGHPAAPHRSGSVAPPAPGGAAASQHHTA